METLILKHTVRTGKTIEHGGDIIICGDVNPSATIRASGNITVMGTAQGILQAGQRPDAGDDAIITAVKLMSPQIKIGKYKADVDVIEPTAQEYAHVVNGKIIIQKIKSK